MAFAISQCTQTNLLSQRSDLEMQMTFLTNSLMQLAMQSQGIVEEQARQGQFYMMNHPDTEGQVDFSAIEYVNSAAFNNKYDSQMAAIQAKEQKLNMQKQQLETKQKAITAQEDGWQKLTDKNIQSGFKYCQ